MATADRFRQQITDSAPLELVTRRQWINWRHVYNEKKDRYDKPPHNPHNTRARASTTDPKTWGTIDEALDAYANKANGLSGVGFVFTEDDPYVGIDLDHCIDESGEIDAWALDLLRRFNSYAEFSPSGEGIHIIVKGTLQKGVKRPHAEMYSSGRYFTFTGERVPRLCGDIREAQQEIDALFAELTQPEEEPAAAPVASMSLGAQDVLELARKASNWPKIDRLLGGDVSGYGSQSEADLALLTCLAFYTRDAGTLRQIFEGSELYRDKATRKYSDGSDYLDRTIDKALELQREVYEPATGRAIIHKGQVVGGKLQASIAKDLADEFFGGVENMPPLPESAHVPASLAAEASPWLDAYIEFSRTESPAGYTHYHEACGLWLLSSLAARRLAYKPAQTTTIWPNLYVALVGQSTLFRKSTTANVARHVLKRVGSGPFVIYPYVSSAENLIRIMRPPKQAREWGQLGEEERKTQKEFYRWAHVRALYIDELGVRIKQILNRRGAYAGLYQVLLQAARGEPIGQHTIERGLEAVHNGYMTLLGSMTPANLRKIGDGDSEMWEDGFFARFSFVCPPIEAKPVKTRWQHTDHVPSEILKPLQEWHNRLAQPLVDVTEVKNEEDKATGEWRVSVDVGPPRYIGISGEAYDAFYRYNDAMTDIVYSMLQQGRFPLAPSYQSLPTTGLRIAMLLASLDGANEIELKHWARAQQIVERWRDSLHHLLDQVEEPKADPNELKLDRVYRVVQEEWRKVEGEQIPISVITRRLRTLPKTEVSNLLQMLGLRKMLTLKTEVAANNRETVYIAPPAGGAEED